MTMLYQFSYCFLDIIYRPVFFNLKHDVSETGLCSVVPVDRASSCLRTSVPSPSPSYFTIDSQSVCLGIEHPCGTCDQILLPVGMLKLVVCILLRVLCQVQGFRLTQQWFEYFIQ
jgi:hypothetical protein